MKREYIECASCGTKIFMRSIESHTSSCPICMRKLCKYCSIEGLCKDCFTEQANYTYRGNIFNLMKLSFPGRGEI